MSNSLRVEQLWHAAKELVRNNQGWKAKTLLRDILTISPQHHAARLQYVEILQGEGELIDALLHCAFAYNHGADLPGLTKKMGDLYFSGGMYREAAACYQELLSAGENDIEVLKKLESCREVLLEDDVVN